MTDRQPLGAKSSGGLGLGGEGRGGQATISGCRTTIAQLLQAQQGQPASPSQWSAPLLTQTPFSSHVLGESRTPRALCGNEAQNC